MPLLSLVEGSHIEAWGDPEIQAYFVESYRLGVPPVTSLSMEAHQPYVLRTFCRLWWAIFHAGELSPQLKERIRIEIAERAGCSYCATSRAGDEATDLENKPTDAGEAAALQFAVTFAERPWEISARHWRQLRETLSERAVVELMVLCAWQYGGPRVLRSWGASAYKSGSRVDLGSLPVRPAYLELAGSGAEWPERAIFAIEPLIETANEIGSPAPDWVDALRGRPDLLVAWCELYRETVHGEMLDPRIGQLVRLDLARQLNSWTWSSGGDRAVTAVGIDGPTIAGLARLDQALLNDRERLALEYCRTVVQNEELSDDLKGRLSEGFSEPQLVELGFAVAVQLGAALLLRSFGAADEAPQPIAMLDDVG